jgi:hypothetical protein
MKSISDQKRVARGDHWRLAQRILRARDHAHRGKWRVLIVAGPQPEEEIKCVRELLPSSTIHAVDIEPEHVALAAAAGADHSIVADLREFSRRPATTGSGLTKVPHDKVSLGNEFDVACLDMTCSANNDLQQMLNVYWAGLSKGGVLLVTFSYGRDVVEVYLENWMKHRAAPYHPELDFIHAMGMPEGVAWRALWLFGAKSKFLRSVIQYRGKEMPMLNCALVKARGGFGDASFVALADGDFEATVTAESISNIYACPRDRILALRRSAAAHRAVQTRRERERV